MVTLNLVGDFKNPWAGDKTKEANLISNWTWSPGTDTFEAVCCKNHRTNSIVVGSFSQFLGCVEEQGRGKIQRINVFTHAAPTLIGFSGCIDYDEEKKEVTVSLDKPTALDLERITTTSPIRRQNVEVETLGAIARRLQNRFEKGAQIIFYACDGGVDIHLLQEVANAFQVIVKGFRQPIWYCPDIEWSKEHGKPPKIDRAFTSANKCMTKHRGFDHLVAYAVTRLPKK